MLPPERFSQLPLFRGLSESSIRLLSQHGSERFYRDGETLFRAGDSPPGIFVVLDGCVRVVRGQDTRYVVVHTERSGGTLAEIPLFSGGVLPGTAIAAEPTSCAIFPRDAIRASIEASPDLAFALLERLALRVRELVRRLDHMTSVSVGARLAAYLLQRCEERQSQAISLGMTQGRLAEELGTVREVLVRELRVLRLADVIVAGRNGWIEVCDMTALRERAGGERISNV